MISSAPSAKQAASAANGRAIPTTNRAAPIGGAMSWLVSSTPPERRAFAMPRSSRRTSRGRRLPPPTSANVSAVPEQEQRDEDQPMFTLPVTIVVARSASTARAGQVDDDDDPDPVDPVGDDARRERRTAAPGRSGRGAPSRRGAGRASGGDEQRPGRERDAVPDVGQDGRREQPPERASEARRGDRLGQAGGGIGHRGSLRGASRGGHLRAVRQRGGTVPSWSVTMPPVSGVQRTSTRPASPMISAIRSGDG